MGILLKASQLLNSICSWDINMNYVCLLLPVSWWQAASAAVPAWQTYSISRQLPHFLASSSMWAKQNNVSIWLTSHDGFQNISSEGLSHRKKMGSHWVFAVTHTHAPTPIICGCKMWKWCLPGSFQIQSCEWELHAWNEGMRMLLLFVSFCSSDILGFYVDVMTYSPKACRTKSRASMPATREG